jgi:ribonuclease HII
MPAGRTLRPSLRTERAFIRAGYPLVAGVDEVGRGALAGPVTIGVVVVHAATRSAPVGLRDSKLLTPVARDRLAPKVRRWAPYWAVGHAEAAEVDEYGIIAALRLAGTRALAQLPVRPDIVVLDGNHDYLTPPPEPMFDLDARPRPPLPELTGGLATVRTMIKADVRCTAVAAASVLAKTTRDAIMGELAGTYSVYGWHHNKGYSAPEHLAALAEHGPCDLHRRSWRLPSRGADVGVSEHVGGRA